MQSEHELPMILLVDDDLDFCRVMARAFARRGYAVRVAENAVTAYEVAQQQPPEYAVIDLSLPGESGLALIPRLKALDAETRIVVLTGFASVETAVEAIKLGATHYLAKPADVDDIVAALHRSDGDPHLPIHSPLPTVNRVEWEHLQKALLANGGNISATARQLRMHRRTLQRKLVKRPVE